MRSRSRTQEIPRGARLFDPATLGRLSQARDFIAANFDRRTTLEQVASTACLSPFYFNRLFTEAFGETPHEFLTRTRIERAKRLLLADNDSVTNICFDIGYESLGSFSSRFHSLTGLSPAAFRREGRRIYGGLGHRWKLFYIPGCFQHFYIPQESRSISNPLPVL